MLGCLGCSFSHLSRRCRRLFVPILKTKRDNILDAIRPPSSNLHFFYVDSTQLVKLTVLAGGVSALSAETFGSQWSASLFGRLFSQFSRPRRPVVRSYIEEIKTIFCTPSDHHLPTSIPTLRITYSELSSTFLSAGSAVCRTGTGGRQWGG